MKQSKRCSVSRGILSSLALTLFLSFSLTQSVQALPGDLDTGFSGDGKVTTDISNGIINSAEAIATQSDGRIVVAGVSGNDFAVVRYNSNGMLDNTFGGNGIVATDFNKEFDGASSIAVQADGKILVAGSANLDGKDSFAVARYNANGTLDTTFNGDGKLTTTGFGGFSDTANALAIHKANGRILVAGNTLRDDRSRFALARYHAFECNGFNVTILGTPGADTINGTNFGTGAGGGINGDIINGLGGGDTINGLAANDLICGGGGNDTINGGTGSDTLLGQNDADSLDGGTDAGGDTDTCVGGGQSGDTFANCESINTGSSGFSGKWIDIFQNCNRSGQNSMCKVKGIVEVENPGTESTAVSTQVAFYLSDDEILDESDRFLEYVNVPALEPGERTDVRLNVKLRGEEDLFGLFGIVVLDFFNSVPERNEDNNVVVSPTIR